jgi:hypothetical protein
MPVKTEIKTETKTTDFEQEFRDTFETMTKDEIKEYLTDAGYSVDDSLTKDKLVDAAVKFELSNRDTAAKTSGESAKKQSKDTGDRIINVRFQNIENPGCELEFTLEAGKYKYRLYDGQVYELPVKVVEHLNSLQVPFTQPVIDANTGEQRGIRKTMRNRFSCIPVNMKL